MNYPKEFVSAVKANQAMVDACANQVIEVGQRWKKAQNDLKAAKGDKKFLQKYRFSLCRCVKGVLGIWIEYLGGPEQEFIDLQEKIIKLEKIIIAGKSELEKAWDKKRGAQQDLNDCVDQYLRTTSLLYQKRSEVAEAIRKIDIIAEAFYREATDIRCDLIGFKKPEEFEKIRAAGMERMRVLLPKAIEDLALWEKFATERADDGLIAPFGEWLTSLFDRLQSCSLRSKAMADTEKELDVILEIMRRMTNGTRNSDTDIEKWLTERIKHVKTLALKEAAES